jgi:hypothetical protein
MGVFQRLWNCHFFKKWCNFYKINFYIKVSLNREIELYITMECSGKEYDSFMKL